MKKDLVNRAQPFGEVKNVTMHPGLPIDRGSKNPVSAKTERDNNCYDSRISNADPNPRAMEHATRHSDNPFFWTHGMPRK